MGKQFEWFCRERVILDQKVNPNSTEDLEEFEKPTNVSVKYYVCVRLGNKLIDNNRLYSKLGLLPETDIIASRTKIAIDKFRHFKDATHFGVFSEMPFSIIPTDPAYTVEPSGAEYYCYVPFNTSTPFDNIKRRLQDHELEFMSGTQTIKYQVVPGSIRIKRTPNNRRSA